MKRDGCLMRSPILDNYILQFDHQLYNQRFDRHIRCRCEMVDDVWRPARQRPATRNNERHPCIDLVKSSPSCHSTGREILREVRQLGCMMDARCWSSFKFPRDFSVFAIPNQNQLRPVREPRRFSHPLAALSLGLSREVCCPSARLLS